MKKDNNSTYRLNLIILAITLVSMVALAYIYSVFILKVQVIGQSSRVPVLNVPASDKLKAIYNDKRVDIDTNGKPDISKFDFGNPEPFK